MDMLMEPALREAGAHGWDAQACEALIAELQALRAAMLEHERHLGPWIAQAQPAHEAGARNLAHYLAMRAGDVRRLQDSLARLGLSSLGRSESHVLANLDKVLGLLHVLTGRPWRAAAGEPVGYGSGREQLARRAEALFGPVPAERDVRIMVTLPGTAAHDPALVGALVHAGMDVARINCAHDNELAWMAMASHVRRAAAASGRSVKVLMDLAGPKIRTGPIAAGPSVLRLKPQRDAYGRIVSPALVGLRAVGSTAPVLGASAVIEVDAEWLAQLRAGDTLEFVDARDSTRQLTVLDERPGAVLAECARSAYLTPSTQLRLAGRERAVPETAVSGLPAPVGSLRLHRGDMLRLVAEGLGQPGSHGGAERRVVPATVACTLPAVLEQVRKGERVWFDDGRIGGVIRRVSTRGVDVEITEVPDGGLDLQADKGINFPDSPLDLPALTTKDREDLDVVARHADIVGLSFAQRADDVRELRDELAARGADALGLMLKIETRRGFEHLPELLFAAMGARAAGVMIARGDLAVECGFERMAEVQEEILWACEAAHMPVVWATQVLETLAKKGQPSRAEITDAAMGERAECVMLNKGPHILAAMRTLDDVLRRMQGHQSKKRPLMRALQSWRLGARA